jgi:hypothetical protein
MRNGPRLDPGAAPRCQQRCFRTIGSGSFDGCLCKPLGTRGVGKGKWHGSYGIKNLRPAGLAHKYLAAIKELPVTIDIKHVRVK